MTEHNQDREQKVNFNATNSRYFDSGFCQVAHTFYCVNKLHVTWDVIIYPCADFNYGFIKSSLKLWYGWVIISTDLRGGNQP